MKFDFTNATKILVSVKQYNAIVDDGYFTINIATDDAALVLEQIRGTGLFYEIVCLQSFGETDFLFKRK